MKDQVLQKCSDILNQDLDDEQKLFNIDEIISQNNPDMPRAHVERTVLDIMLNHINLPPPTSSCNLPEKDKTGSEANTNVDVDLSLYKPFDQLRIVLGANSNEDLERVLASQDYDFYRTVKLLQGDSAEVNLSKAETASRIICKYYIRGQCMRGDGCMYSHSTQTRICRFWLHERCILPVCPFLHGIPELPETPKQAESGNQVRVNARTGNPNPNIINLHNLPKLSGKTIPKLEKSIQNVQQQAAVKPKTTQRDLRESLKRVSEVLPHATSGLKLEQPKFTPWKSKFGQNELYVKLRTKAAALSKERNNLLHQSCEHWRLNDGLRAKKNSVKGHNIHNEMIALYREASDLLWNQRNAPAAEIWIDLHGLNLSEAIEIFEDCVDIVKEETAGKVKRLVYVITGRGHYLAKNYADQMSQCLETYLDAKGFLHRKCEVNFDFGRVTVVDPYSSLTEKIN